MEFSNQDHAKLSVRIEAATTTSNAGLVRNDEFDTYAANVTASTTIMFGSSGGAVGGT